MQMSSLAAAPAATLHRPYPRFVTLWLWFDLALCVIMGVMGLAASVHLLSGGFGPTPASRAIAETVIQYGIAVFGISGNLLLLRRRRNGFWLACVALAFVATGLVVSLMALPAVIGTLQSETEILLLVGFVITWGARWLVNLVYAFALRNAWRCLAPAAPASSP